MQATFVPSLVVFALQNTGGPQSPAKGKTCTCANLGALAYAGGVAA